MNEILSMGGYGGYVWSAYAVTFVVLGSAIAFVWRRYARAKAKLAEAS